MADNGNPVDVKFGASIGELIAKLNTAGGAVSATVAGMQSSLDKLGAGWSRMLGAVGVGMAALAGGAIFKGMVEEAQSLNGETIELAKALGITGEAASVLRLAIGDAGSSTEAYLSANKQFTRQLKNNEEELVSLGIATRDSNGALRDSQTLFGEAAQKVETYRQGVDQAVVGMKIFGRGTGDVSKFAKLTALALEDAREKAQSLGLIMTQDGLESTIKYKRAMNDVRDVTEGVKYAIGTALIPGLVDMAKKFSDVGPTIVVVVKSIIEAFLEAKLIVADTLGVLVSLVADSFDAIGSSIRQVFGGDGVTAMEVFHNVLRLVSVSLVVFRVAVEQSVNFARTALNALGSLLVSFGDRVKRVLSGDFLGGGAAWRRALVDFALTLRAGMAESVRIVSKGAKDIDTALTKPFSSAAKDGAGRIGKEGSNTAPKKVEDGEAKARIALTQAEAQAELEAFKEALKYEQEASDDAYKNNLVALQEYYTKKLRIELAGIDAAMLEKQREIDSIDNEKTGKNETERLQIAAQRAKIFGELVKLELEYTNASVKNSRDRTNAEREEFSKLQNIKIAGAQALSSAELAIEEGAAKQMLALKQIDEQQELLLEKVLADKKLAIAKNATAEKMKLSNGSKAIEDQLREDDLRSEEQHAQRIIEIDRQMELERQKLSIQASESVQNAFVSFFETVASGTTSIKKALLSLVSSISAAVTKLAAEMLAKNIFGAGGGGFGGTIAGLLGGLFGAADGAASGAPSGNAAQGFSFAGGRAEGGSVYPSQMYMVGERGPEMFVPRNSGTIVPTGGLGGISVVNHFAFAGQVDTSTQSQVAAAAARGLRRASARNN